MQLFFQKFSVRSKTGVTVHNAMVTGHGVNSNKPAV